MKSLLFSRNPFGDESLQRELWEAATKGDLETVKRLSRIVPDINWADPEYRRTCFFRACGHGKSEVVKFLLANPKVNVCQPNSENCSPLFIAAQEGNTAVVELLLKDGRCKANEQEIQGSTPLFIACQNGHVDIVKLLLEEPTVDINMARKDHVAPIFMAACNGQTKCVQLLLASDKGVDLNVTWSQKSIRDISVQEGRDDIVKVILNLI
mgnify:CR=1 FL=1